MADIDINELQNITAMADADELLAIANGLGKNITWAKIKELLTEQLPESTNISKGLLPAWLYNIVYDLQYSINKTKLDTPLDWSNYEYCKLQRTSYIQGVTPSGSNFAFVIRFKIDTDNECQYLFDYGGYIYHRVYSSGTWSAMKSVAKPS